MLRRGDIFSPKVGLDAKDVLPLLRVKPLKRLVAVNFLKRKISADAERLLVLILGLIVVKVAVGVWGHDDVKSHRGGLDAAVRASP